MLSLNHSEKEIQKLQEKLDQRGGSKKNNVYDVIRHNKKKMRVGAVLDQRANSIADLAAVLAEQESLGAKTQQSKEDEAKSQRDYQVKTMLELAAEVEEGGIEKVSARLKELNEMLKLPPDATAEMSKKQMRRDFRELHGRRLKMRFSSKAVADAREKVDKSLSPAEQEARIAQMLPSFPIPSTPIPKRGGLRVRLARANSPVFSTSGIVVKWANHLDVEYAESWPETIEHKPMGLSRHRAPRADEEAVMDVASYRSKLTEAWEKANPTKITPPQDEIDEETMNALRMAKSSVLSEVKKAVDNTSKRARGIKVTAN